MGWFYAVIAGFCFSFLQKVANRAKGRWGEREQPLRDLRDLLLKFIEYFLQKIAKAAKEESFADVASFCKNSSNVLKG